MVDSDKRTIQNGISFEMLNSTVSLATRGIEQGRRDARDVSLPISCDNDISLAIISIKT